jgi:hypothetical protein
MSHVDEWVVPEPIYQFLATSTGGTEAIGNYSTGAGGSSGAIFAIQPPAGESWRIERMLIHIQDTGIFAAQEYGKLSALTNGIQVRVENDAGTVHDLTAITVKTNAQWSRQCFDTRIDTWGVGDEFLSSRWTFAKGGYPLHLIGDNNERLEVFLLDSTTGLNAHNFYVNGYKVDAAYDHWQ